MQGLIGRKIGMTRIFNGDTGAVIPVTIVETGINVVQQIKTIEKDGYSAVQLGFDICSEKKLNKAQIGHVKKCSAQPTRIVKEFRLDSEDEKLECGQKLGVSSLGSVQYVDVVGVSKGRGFSGTVKRYNFHIGRATHGNTNRRDRGSLGAGTYPARVFPGVKMAGQYGNVQKTVKGVEIVGLDTEANLVYLRGSIPGCNKSVVYIKKKLS